MDRLSLILTVPAGAVITGGLTVLMLSLGFYSWIAIGSAAIIGIVAAWPVAYRISRRIKEADPMWDHSRISRVGPLPNPAAPEV
ncbi:Mn2+ and Fe2+ transporters of the NRAMP family [Rhodovulum sp. P5]|uniref:hypothetical protein n=1 Tax=Rhodovulum sp. P5 TaxID=1564506 RepID=UPI0009C2B97F|nr:hypothetical protein [Rhodovulum sp. P5]ARE41871.1 Mn2+ and Fe2+ transporters of the NRAMP family [Rhodovulum sp. P5]